MLYVVKKTFSEGALILVEMDGKEFSVLINTGIVKKYYAWDDKENDLPKLKPERMALTSKKKKEKKKREKMV